MENRERIIKCIEESGIAVQEDGTMDSFNSVAFVSAILALEEEFQIEISEEYLSIDYMSTIEQVEEVIQLNMDHKF